MNVNTEKYNQMQPEVKMQYKAKFVHTFEFLFSRLLYCFEGIIPEFLRDYFDEKISHAANISLVLNNE